MQDSCHRTVDQLDARLKKDPRVNYHPFMDARTLANLGDQANLVLIDVKFVTVPEILAHARIWLAQGGEIVALVKPPYEREGKARKVRDPREYLRIVDDIIAWVIKNEFEVVGCIESSLLGKSAGKKEFFLCLSVKKG